MKSKRKLCNLLLKVLLAIPILLSILYWIAINLPREVPKDRIFNPTKIGDVFTFDVKVKKKSHYQHTLALDVYLNEYYATKRTGSTAKGDDEKLRSYFLEYGSYRRAPLDIKLDILIINKQTSKIIVNKVIKNPESNVAGFGRTVSLISEYFEPGEYTIKVQYLGGSPKLKELFMNFYFYIPYHGK
ncbi:DUF5625 family protein [Phocoenobacter skyensis]|uniref:DUF5625 family protein n=1 Tax=Phocoenobacter skyensis TaxID=97481 RepID=A0A1H7UYU5_9PAST|nr:DUF5625 family protein [Pasteurella skyensis]MDP8078522.1 DUF5625 family protein [Pasteurella skyensis]MDP8084386.1 DUF5625 family protein [Pasteurella skyensis]MDP8184717.1 DUF5625 family protein [Pasteurella skyensis]QLB23191.1 hypothetical protein A6B44_08220 [Pasteurella skyensis]SEM02083.1 hypothetical protein SAMN05444853_10373 [Pasteurella skyensis]